MQLRDFFHFYRGLPHQDAAIAELQAALPPQLLSREAEWYKTWQAGGKQDDLAPALALIKEFEGCVLHAYPDPGTGGAPWTIGYGNTRFPNGAAVRQGDKISAVEADQMLRLEVDRIASQLGRAIPHWTEMNANQKSALISFAYNVGDGFYGNGGFGTITRALRDRRWKDVPDSLMLYRNPGSSVEAGLRRRRVEEGKLWIA
jgi:GH24 family phage-related lysozyme (muramidase)